MSAVDDAISQWVKRAEATGEVRESPHFGKPFSNDDGYLDTPARLRMTHKILKNAGCLPAEIELLKKLAEAREILNTMTAGSAAANAQATHISELEQRVRVRLDGQRR